MPFSFLLVHSLFLKEDTENVFSLFFVFLHFFYGCLFFLRRWYLFLFLLGVKQKMAFLLLCVFLTVNSCVSCFFEREWVVICLKKRETLFLIEPFYVGNYYRKNQYFFFSNFLLCFKYCLRKTICAVERIHFYGTRIKI